MIAGTMQPDDGRVLVDGGMTIGHFNQDVGEMSGPPRGGGGHDRNSKPPGMIEWESATVALPPKLS
jgi:hypothetical protein